MVYALGLLLLLAGICLLVFGFRLYAQPKVGEQISVWRTLVPVLDEPAEHFYARLYQALKASLQERLPESGEPVEIVLIGMGFGPHRLFATPSLFAERPVYLLVRYQHLRCYIYAGQTPAGLFVSSWGYSDYHVGEGANQRRAFNKRAWKYFSRQTLFQFDAAIMFTDAVHNLLSDTVDTYRQAKGLQPLEAMERRPILHAFYQNPFYANASYQNQSYQQQAPVDHLHQAPLQPYWSHQPIPLNGYHAAVPNHHPALANDHHSPSVSPVPSMPPTPQPLFAMDAPAPPQPVTSAEPFATNEAPA